MFCPLSLSGCHGPPPPSKAPGKPHHCRTHGAEGAQEWQLVLEPGRAFQTHISTWWHSEIKMHLMWSSLVAYVFVIENNMKILQFHHLKYISHSVISRRADRALLPTRPPPAAPLEPLSRQGRHSTSGTQEAACSGARMDTPPRGHLCAQLPGPAHTHTHTHCPLQAGTCCYTNAPHARNMFTGFIHVIAHCWMPVSIQ